MERPFSNENLKTFYTERLGTISSRKELEAALQEEKINLELKIDDFVSPECREEILRNNPDTIEIAGTEHKVQYSYDDWNKKFIASVKIPAANILKLTEMPTLPSGRNITFEIVSKEGENYVQFSGDNLEELRQESRQLLIEKQWDEWRYSKEAPQKQYLEKFDLFGELPSLPEPVKFGIDPETNEPIFAFPAIIVEPCYYNYNYNEYFIKYFSSYEEAKLLQANFLKIVEEAKIEQRKKEEKERLLALTRDLFSKVKSNFNNVSYDYGNYGLSYSDRDDIENKLWQAERKIKSETKEALEILQELDTRITQALDYKEKRMIAKEKVEIAIAEHYSVCPLCDKQLENDKCSNSEHDVERVDFEFNEEGEEIGPVILSQIITDQGKIVAQLRVSHGEGKKPYRRYCGDVYIMRGSDIEENGWQGELFESLKFEDFNKILTMEQAEEKRARLEAERQEREFAEAQACYQKDLEYAKQQVEQGYWKRGKFTKSTHPKTGEEQWEYTLKNKGLVVKYVVDRWSRQPTTEGLVYFYSEEKTLVDTRSFRLILVYLKDPFPEDEPKKPEVLLSTSSSSQLETSSQSFQASLEELRKKFSKK